MIIQCERCKTKYNFDESTIEGEGFWVRCTHCEHVFFQENPMADTIPPLVDLVEPEEVEPEEEDERVLDDLSMIIDEIERGDERGVSEKIEDIYAPEEREDRPEETITLKKKKVLWSLPELIAYLIVVILVVGGVYMWLFPDLGMKVIDRITTLPVFERIIGTKEVSQESVDVTESAIEITDIEERYIENWVLGTILVVEGIVVNNNDYSVSKIRVRGKVLNESGGSIMEVKSYCGTIISDEELSNLTEIEIRQELSNPYGKGFPNKDIPYGGRIPFMLVFTNPAEGASEFTVELAGVEEEKW